MADQLHDRNQSRRLESDSTGHNEGQEVSDFLCEAAVLLAKGLICIGASDLGKGLVNAGEHLLQNGNEVGLAPFLLNVLEALPESFASEGVVLVDKVLGQQLLKAVGLTLLQVSGGQQRLNDLKVVLDVLAGQALQRLWLAELGASGQEELSGGVGVYKLLGKAGVADVARHGQQRWDVS